MNAVIRLFSSFLFCLVSAQAELAPDVYSEMQAEAGEAITIKVDAVTSTKLGVFDFSGTRNVRIVATVIAVTKTTSGLKPGMKIAIVYVHRPLQDGMVGPSPVPQLKEGNTYPAWLSAGPKHQYAPAALGYSFSQIGH